LLGNLQIDLYWFDTEGVKKTKMRGGAGVRERGPQCGFFFRTNHPKVASDPFPSLAKEGSLGRVSGKDKKIVPLSGAGFYAHSAGQNE
jgi:hypothetical protein